VIFLSYDVRLDKDINNQMNQLKRSGQKDIVDRILRGLDKLADDPLRPRTGVDILQLRDLEPTVFRLRIGDYRIFYTIDRVSRIVWVTGILHRKRAYRK